MDGVTEVLDVLLSHTNNVKYEEISINGSGLIVADEVCSCDALNPWRYEWISFRSIVAVITSTSLTENCEPWATNSPFTHIRQHPSKYNLPPSPPLWLEKRYTPPPLIKQRNN